MPFHSNPYLFQIAYLLKVGSSFAKASYCHSIYSFSMLKSDQLYQYIILYNITSIKTILVRIEFSRIMSLLNQIGSSL